MVVNMSNNSSSLGNEEQKPPLSFSISRILDLDIKMETNADGMNISRDHEQTEEDTMLHRGHLSLHQSLLLGNKGQPQEPASSEQAIPYVPLSYSLWLHDRTSSRRLGHPYQSRAPPKRKKQRASFSRHQIKELEKLFSKKKYLSSSERQQIAKKLDMTDCQVKTWYQNRRTKWKREKEEEKQEERQAIAKALMTTQRDWWGTKNVFGCQ